jgi:hypothetical protein
MTGFFGEASGVGTGSGVPRPGDDIATSSRAAEKEPASWATSRSAVSSRGQRAQNDDQSRRDARPVAQSRGSRTDNRESPEHR